jgi:hypothetical protein
MAVPSLPGDPRNREELAHWLKERERNHPGVPLSAREVLMIKSLQTRRPPYSLT